MYIMAMIEMVKVPLASLVKAKRVEPFYLTIILMFRANMIYQGRSYQPDQLNQLQHVNVS
jgi:hypothetical protein